MEVSGTIYEYTEDERYRPTREIWNHTNITITDAVIEVMKNNGLVNDNNANVNL